MAELHSIDGGKTDADLAKEYRDRTAAAMAIVAEIINEAKAHGLAVSCALMQDQNGRHFVGPVNVVKPL